MTSAITDGAKDSVKTTKKMAVKRFMKSVDRKIVVLVHMSAPSSANRTIPFIRSHRRVWAVVKERVVIYDGFLTSRFTVTDHHIHVAASCGGVKQGKRKRPSAINLLLDFAPIQSFGGSHFGPKSPRWKIRESGSITRIVKSIETES